MDSACSACLWAASPLSALGAGDVTSSFCWQQPSSSAPSFLRRPPFSCTIACHWLRYGACCFGDCCITSTADACGNLAASCCCWLSPPGRRCSNAACWLDRRADCLPRVCNDQGATFRASLWHRATRSRPGNVGSAPRTATAIHVLRSERARPFGRGYRRIHSGLSSGHALLPSASRKR